MSIASADLRRQARLSHHTAGREVEPSTATDGSFGRGFLVATALVIPCWVALVALVVGVAKLLG